jgi:hypothetical protein
MAAFGLLAACASSSANSGDGAPSLPAAERFSVTLERGPCFGACPDYSVTVSADGAVIFEGRRFVGTIGSAQAQIDVREAARLRRMFEDAGVFELRDEYVARLTDLPTYELRIVIDGRRKSIRDYGGLMIDMPPVVEELENQVDRVAGTARWVAVAPTPAE